MKAKKLLALALSVIMALAPTAVFAEGETPEKYNMDPTHLTFATQEDYDAIVTKVNESEITLENGEIKAVTKDLAEAPDPYINISLENLETTIQAEEYPYCVLVFKCPMTNDWKENVVSQMYFSVNDSKYSESLTTYAYVSVGDRYAYAIFTPGLCEGWNGTLTSLRVDYFYSHYVKDGNPTPIPEGETMYIRDIFFCKTEADARNNVGTYVYELNRANSPAPTCEMDPTHIVFATDDDYASVVYRDDGKDPGKRTIVSHEDEAVKFTVDLGGATADPYAYVSFGKLVNMIQAEDYPYCAIIYKMPTTNSAVTSTLDVYFNTKGTFPVDNSQMLSTSTRTSDSYQYAVFNPGSLSDWTSVVTSVRLDYLNNNMQDGDVFYVHDIIFAADANTARSTAQELAGLLNIPDEAVLSFNVGNYGVAPESQTIVKGELPVQPDDPTSDEMLFDGWYTSKTYNTPFDFTKPLTKEKVVAYAKWVSGIKVSFVCPDEAQNVPANQLVKKNGRAVEPEAPTIEGMELEGWYTDAEYTTAYDFNALVKDEITLYAKFVVAVPRYNITVIGGRASVDQAKADDTVSVYADDPAEGKVFDKWVVTAVGTELIFNETSANAMFIMPACDVTFTATYKDAVTVKMGDVDGDGHINARDVILVMRASLPGFVAPADYVADAADMDGDKNINARDVIEVMKAALNEATGK